jgi:hypothetical protein
VKVYEVPGKNVSPTADHTYRVPAPATDVTVGTPIAAGCCPAEPTTTGDTVSVTVMFSIVTPPVFATITLYVTASPTCGAAGTCCFVTVYAKVGATSRKSVSFVYCRDHAHGVDAVTHAVFETVVCTHTGPTIPEIVNVYVVPGFIPNPPHRLHAYCVPLAACVMTGAAHPAGRSVVTPVIVGEIVSVTVRQSTVAVPPFVTMIRYETGSPIPGDATLCCFKTFTTVVGGWTSAPTLFVNMFVLVHADVPIM